MLIRNADVLGRGLCDVRLENSWIVAVAAASRESTAKPGEEIVDAEGGALLPGLHDHHIHLRALAAAERSLRCGPPEVRDEAALARALAQATSAGGSAHPWIRGIGYHESVAGELDRYRLDAWVPDRPLRIQHRSGMLWIVNSCAASLLGLDDERAGSAAATGQPSRKARNHTLPGIERDASGRFSGRLFRMDEWLRQRIGEARDDSGTLSCVGRRLAKFGVVGVTDATASNGAAELNAIEAAVAAGALPQRVMVMGALTMPSPRHPRVAVGPHKILLDEYALPGRDALIQSIDGAHRVGRAVAIHCVTRTSLVFALDCLDAAGCSGADRIEHASVTPPQALDWIARLGLTVVTQPGFVRERGDAYAREVDDRDRPWLYRGRAFFDGRVGLAAGSDAPFGAADPWQAMRAAVERRTLGGLTLGADEALSPEQALALFTTSADDPGGQPRLVAVGQPAELCLLDRPWREARRELSSRLVRRVIQG